MKKEEQMPLKGSNKARYQRAYMRRKRSNREGLTEKGLTREKPEGLTGLKRPNRLGADGLPEMVENEYNPNELLPDGAKRYLGPFSDGQVLDRTTVPVI